MNKSETKRKFVKFNTRVVCSKCERKAVTACGRCQVSYYCSKQCQIADWSSFHKFVCPALKEYQTTAQAAMIVANYNFIDVVIAWIKKHEDVYNAFKSREVWLQLLCSPDPSMEDLHDLKAMSASLKENFNTSSLVAHHISGETKRKTPLVWPADAPIKYLPSPNESVLAPWFVPAFDASFVFPEIIVVIYIAGVVDMPEELRILKGAPEGSIFGRSIGFITMNE